MSISRRLATALGALAVACAAWPLPSSAQQFHGEDGLVSHARAPVALGSQWVPISPLRLQAMRGGFDLPSGLSLAFGIQRVVYVNGALVASTSFNIADVARMTPEQAVQLAQFTTPMSIQIGDGNTFDPSSIAGGAAGLVIQNSLDGQDIRALTTITVGVDTLGAFQDLNANSALHDALISVPGAP